MKAIKLENLKRDYQLQDAVNVKALSPEDRPAGEYIPARASTGQLHFKYDFGRGRDSSNLQELPAWSASSSEEDECAQELRHSGGFSVSNQDGASLK